MRSPVAHARLTGVRIPDHLRICGFHRQGPDRRAADPGGVAAARLSGFGAASAGHRQDPPRRRADRDVRRRYAAREAEDIAAQVVVEYEELPAVVDMLKAQRARQRRWCTIRSKGTSISRSVSTVRYRSRGEDRAGQGHARGAHGAAGHVADRVPRLHRAVGCAAQSADPPRRHPVSARGAHRAGAGAANPRNRRFASSPPMWAAASATRRSWRRRKSASAGLRCGAAIRCAGSRTGASSSRPTPTAANITTYVRLRRRAGQVPRFRCQGRGRFRRLLGLPVHLGDRAFAGQRDPARARTTFRSIAARRPRS